MYIYTRGDLFQSGAQALVNPINTVGIMGKGLAVQFKKRYPDMFKEYMRVCMRGDVQIGKMWVYKTNRLCGPEYIINFPSKRHWREKSRVDDIFLGLRDLVSVLINKKIHSVAIPPIGCGNGGLPWDKIRRIMEDIFIGLPDKKILIYEPLEQPIQLPLGPTPKLTVAHAAILDLLFQFLELGYENTWLTVQKLAYFLQEAGMSLQLDYKKTTYGPYADNVRHLLLPLEGHYLHGMYDGSSLDRFTVLEPLPNIHEEVRDFIAEHEGIFSVPQRVKKLIYGFESPYGLELLAAVHWSVIHDKKSSRDIAGIIENIRHWMPQKAHVLSEDHITTTYKRLMEESWLMQ